mmetsp:Transcript_32859/g.84188  ORF Transcript_32859/g.84188 Transcript_32859/m.84188 type:complete len:224 (-) Transcript_32859:1354-2025(-)
MLRLVEGRPGCQLLLHPVPVGGPLDELVERDLLHLFLVRRQDKGLDAPLGSSGDLVVCGVEDHLGVSVHVGDFDRKHGTLQFVKDLHRAILELSVALPEVGGQGYPVDLVLAPCRVFLDPRLGVIWDLGRRRAREVGDEGAEPRDQARFCEEVELDLVHAYRLDLLRRAVDGRGEVHLVLRTDQLHDGVDVPRGRVVLDMLLEREAPEDGCKVLPLDVVGELV